ncbi:MAG: hypothetical protein AAGI45_01805 [Cyanobacteria bacterium P01_H01_bin.26]
MSSQTFSLKSLQTLRRFLKQRLVLPECEHTPNRFADDEMPEPDSLADLSNLFDQGGLTPVADSVPNTNGRWFISTVDASNVIKQLPGLTFHPNYCLVTYLYRVQKANISHGRAATWAIAKRLSSTRQLEAALDLAGDHTNPPTPDGALLNYMTAVAGDLTAGSFLKASILQRELQEFGRCGQFNRWQHHRLIDTIPQQCGWQWRIQQPKNLAPTVHHLANGKLAVEFYTCRVASPIGIFRHIDRYPAKSYVAKANNQPIAARRDNIP